MYPPAPAGAGFAHESPAALAAPAITPSIPRAPQPHTSAAHMRRHHPREPWAFGSRGAPGVPMCLFPSIGCSVRAVQHIPPAISPQPQRTSWEPAPDVSAGAGPVTSVLAADVRPGALAEPGAGRVRRRRGSDHVSGRVGQLDLIRGREVHGRAVRL